MLPSTAHPSLKNLRQERRPQAFLVPLILVSMMLLLSLGGCSDGKRPFATARVCLPAASALPEFVTLLHEIGQANRMTFFDRTPETRADRKVLGNANGAIRTDGFILNVGVLRPDGMGVTASEIVGPGQQVALGFSKADDAAEAKRFTDTVVHRIGRRWRIEVIRGAAGVQPFDRCP